MIFYRSFLFILVLLLGCSNVFGKTKADRDDESVAPDSKAEHESAPASVPSLTKEQTEGLRALGYFDRAKTQNPDARSVTTEKERACDGLNLYGSRDRAEAYLVDMGGKVLHTWKAPNPKPPWMHMVLLHDGSLLVISKANYVAKLDKDSKVLWKTPLGAHHDVTVAPDGNIYVLTHKLNHYHHRDVDIPIMDDYIVVLSPDGKELSKHRLFPVLRSLVSTRRLDRLAEQTRAGVSARKLIAEGAPGDTSHTNSLQVLSRPIEGIAPAGSILLSVREIDRIVILDKNVEKVLWSWGKGELEGQHHATHLENGNILLFDNGVRRKQSRVLEMDPVSGKIVWSFAQKGFYTRLRGSAQKLPCGNVLAVESDSGHAVEISPDKKVVWEFWNPDVRGKETPTRAVIYRMMRYPLDYLDQGVLKQH